MLEAWTWKRILWSLRKARLPVGPNDLVLDVGSGGNPHPAADVLIDRYMDSKHRFGAPFIADRPTVLGDACKMPFKDKAFDFVIAFHILEHMNNPTLFLNELERVGKAGYIETPNVLFERLVPYEVHLLEVMEIDGMLLIHKKKSSRPDPFINELDLISKSQRWNRLFYGNPELFHVRYFWKDKIAFKIVNPEISCDWFINPDHEKSIGGQVLKSVRSPGLRGIGLSLLREWYKFRKRRTVDLFEIFVCPECHGSLRHEDRYLDCKLCRMRYIWEPIANFNNGISIG